MWLATRQEIFAIKRSMMGKNHVHGVKVLWEWYSCRMNKTYDLIETPLTNIDGTISKLTIFRDITERKRLEDARTQAEERQLQLLAEL